MEIQPYVFLVWSVHRDDSKLQVHTIVLAQLLKFLVEVDPDSQNELNHGCPNFQHQYNIAQIRSLDLKKIILTMSSSYISKL